jgi:hypothetical protein
MSLLSPFVMLPILLALLIFMVLSVRYDQASFQDGPHLALACLCVLVTISYVLLAIAQFLSPHADMAFAGFALILLLGALAEIASNWRVP